jgi:hypothetical protein
MPTKDGLTNDHPLPLFLAEHAEEPEQWDIGKARDRAVISSRILKTSILIVTATAIGVAAISVGNPVVLLANVTASLLDTSPGTGQSTPTIQSTVGTKDLLPTARDEPPINPKSALPSDGKTAATDAPTRNEIAAALEPADQSQAEAGQTLADDLFRQFQEWAAEQDQRAQVRSAQPAQDAPAQVVQDAQRQVRPMHVHRQVRHVQNARAEIRPVQNLRKKVRREQNARAQVPPVRDARALGQSVQNAQAPSFLQSLGSSSVQSQVAVGPVSSPIRTAPGAFDLTNPAIASGTESTTPSRTTDPFSFTTQIDVCFNDTSSPT